MIVNQEAHYIFDKTTTDCNKCIIHLSLDPEGFEPTTWRFAASFLINDLIFIL